MELEEVLQQRRGHGSGGTELQGKSVDEVKRAGSSRYVARLADLLRCG